MPETQGVALGYLDLAPFGALAMARQQDLRPCDLRNARRALAGSLQWLVNRTYGHASAKRPVFLASLNDGRARYANGFETTPY